MDDDDRAAYLRGLRSRATETDVAVHAYVLMDNHVHLLVTPGRKGAISELMQRLGACYVRNFNERHARSGTLWEGRFRSCIVDSDAYLWNCHRYIELNPVRAAMVERPSAYRWSSHRANALGTPDPTLKQHPNYLALGPCLRTRASAYADIFATPISQSVWDEIRLASRLDGILGDVAFQERVKADTGLRPSSGRPGRPRKVDLAKTINLL